MKKQILTAILFQVITITAFAQETNWKLSNGRAIAEKKITAHNLKASDIYTMVNRWLLKNLDAPEENVQARLDNEYLKLKGYCTDFVRMSAHTTGDLQYTYSFRISDETLIIEITEAVIIFDMTPDGVQRVEECLALKSGKHSMTNEKILASLDKFSNSLFTSIESSIRPMDVGTK